MVEDIFVLASLEAEKSFANMKKHLKGIFPDKFDYDKVDNKPEKNQLIDFLICKISNLEVQNMGLVTSLTSEKKYTAKLGKELRKLD